MYLAVDIGGTKTLVATLNNDGVITERLRFETPKKYEQFIKLLAESVANLSTDNFLACGIGFPGRLNREQGLGVALGNLPWENVRSREQETTHWHRTYCAETPRSGRA